MPISFIWYLLVPCVMTGLVIGTLGKVAHLWYNFLFLCEMSPCESSFPYVKLSHVVASFIIWTIIKKIDLKMIKDERKIEST